MKIAVYTCITDNYAPLVAPAVVADGVDYLCFSDGTMDDVEPWQFKPLKPFFANPIRNARLPKILSHRYLAEYDFTIWLDVSLQLIVEPMRVFEFVQNNAEGGFLPSFTAIKNSRRDSLQDEFQAIRESKWSRKNRVSSDLLDEQQLRYGACKTTVYYGGFIARMNCTAIKFLEEQWFKEYCLWQHRDLPSMHFALSDSSVRTATIPGDIKSNEFVKWVK